MKKREGKRRSPAVEEVDKRERDRRLNRERARRFRKKKFEEVTKDRGDGVLVRKCEVCGREKLLAQEFKPCGRGGHEYVCFDCRGEKQQVDTWNGRSVQDDMYENMQASLQRKKRENAEESGS